MIASRRSILLAACAALPLAACAGVTPAQLASDAVTDLGLIANGFTALLPEVSGITGLSSGAVASIENFLSEAKTTASNVSATITQAAALPVVQQIETYFQEALNLLGVVSLPAPFSTVITALKVLLPVVEAAVGLTAPVGAAPGGMTPAQARAVLAVA